MKNNLEEKIRSFLVFYESIYNLDYAYSDVNEEKQSLVRLGSRKLFDESISFLEKIPLNKISSVLDIGMGYGFHCEYFVEKGIQTVGIATHLPENLIAKANEKGYAVKKQDMHFLDFPDEEFDLVWSHHSLEHSFSPLLALREWYRVLKPGGYLAVTVPPHKDQIVGGHYNVGWSIGQLIYLLGICGYDLKSGFFIEEGYNVRALVKRPIQSIEFKGIGLISNLKKYLPDSIEDIMRENPYSLSKMDYNGALKEVTNDKCICKKND